MVDMIKVNTTVSIPAGEYCDICTPERVESLDKRQPDGSIRVIQNRVAGVWEYRCPFAWYGKPRPSCALFNQTLENAQYIKGDPIAHRLLKCSKCTTALAKANK